MLLTGESFLSALIHLATLWTSHLMHSHPSSLSSVSLSHARLRPHTRTPHTGAEGHRDGLKTSPEHYQVVHPARSMPVSALQVRMAVRMSTFGSLSGLAPSREGLQYPPIAIVSFLPFSPTRKLMRRVGWTKHSRMSLGSSLRAQDLRKISSIAGTAISITCGGETNKQ